MNLPAAPTLPLSWDIFCRVIDNHGDLGVCWRLCADLAQRGHAVRLWVDDASALAWMAPQGCTGVELRQWPSAQALQVLSQDPQFQVAAVVVEAFGCALPESFQALMAQQAQQGPPPVWLNLEYLSAEAYVARSHGLASPVMHGPARGLVKHFFFPGFTPDTGGLLREPALEARQTAFDRKAWLRTLALGAGHARKEQNPPIQDKERLISLFCYEPMALPALLTQLSQSAQPTRLLVAQGRPQAAVAAATHRLGLAAHGAGALHISPLPYLTQTDFDHLLWSCDFNFVRGEDSLVRALWAGQPFAWQLYPQDDLAHHDKLNAFAQALQMPASLQSLHAVWNGAQTGPLPEFTPSAWAEWRRWSRQTGQQLRKQTDLCSQLICFAARFA